MTACFLDTLDGHYFAMYSLRMMYLWIFLLKLDLFEIYTSLS